MYKEVEQDPVSDIVAVDEAQLEKLSLFLKQIFIKLRFNKAYHDRYAYHDDAPGGGVLSRFKDTQGKPVFKTVMYSAQASNALQHFMNQIIVAATMSMPWDKSKSEVRQACIRLLAQLEDYLNKQDGENFMISVSEDDIVADPYNSKNGWHVLTIADLNSITIKTFL